MHFFGSSTFLMRDSFCACSSEWREKLKRAYVCSCDNLSTGVLGVNMCVLLGIKLDYLFGVDIDSILWSSFEYLIPI